MELLALAALLAVAWVETARALGGKPLRNDIVMIFTDGEEPGLLGASSYVAEHPMSGQRGVVPELGDYRQCGPIGVV
jgi:acetylornithine deacetylase/succinyl-diaminopimelate desuccinylase-like protein